MPLNTRPLLALQATALAAALPLSLTVTTPALAQAASSPATTQAPIAESRSATTRASLPAAKQSAPATPAASPELTELRQAVQQLREQYEGRLQALEQRLKDAEARAAATAPVQAAGQAAMLTSTQATEPQASPQGGGGGFNPSVSLILSGNYAHLSKDPATWQLSGFAMGEGEAGPGSKGLNLGESEVSFAANIDPWWYGALTLSFAADNSVSAEEAFVQTTALSNGLKLKVGRFFSGLGYLNEQHAHTWDFADAPLAYQAFLGGQLGQDGVQARWLAPTDQFIELGAEAARGQASDNGAGRMALFAHTGGDVGDSHSWRAGISQLWERSLSRSLVASDSASGQTVSNTFTGHDRLTVLDGVWKWAPNGNATHTHFKLQGEYVRRQAQGQLLAGLDANDSTVPGQLGNYTSVQSGWYLQGIYQFMPGWRVGLRHDQLNVGRNDLGLNASVISIGTHQPKRDSLMLDWALSEFSRWRVQFNRDQARPGSADPQFYLQYQMSLGAHGAHSY